MSINSDNSGQDGQGSLPARLASVSRDVKPSEASRPRVVRIGTAAAMLTVCEKSVRRLIDRGKLRRVQGIRHVLIPISEIDKFIAGDK